MREADGARTSTSGVTGLRSHKSSAAREQVWMIRLHPGHHLIPDRQRELSHGRRVGVRRNARAEAARAAVASWSAALYAMLNRQSTLTCPAALSVRSRSTTASRSPISRALVWCAVSHPYFSHSTKLMFGPYDQHLRLAENRLEKMMTCAKLLLEFFARIQGRINVPSELLLNMRQCCYDLGE